MGLGDGSVEVWDYVQSQKRLAWRAHTGPGAKIRGVFECGGFIWLWLTFPVRALCYHPSQPLLATGGDDGRVKVWPANAMEITRVMFRYQANLSLNVTSKDCFSLAGHTDYVRCLLFSTLHPWLFSGSDDCSICVWNWQSRSSQAYRNGSQQIKKILGELRF